MKNYNGNSCILVIVISVILLFFRIGIFLNAVSSNISLNADPKILELRFCCCCCSSSSYVRYT